MALFPCKQKYSNLYPHNPASPWVILRIGCELDCCVQGNIPPCFIFAPYRPHRQWANVKLETFPSAYFFFQIETYAIRAHFRREELKN